MNRKTLVSFCATGALALTAARGAVTSSVTVNPGTATGAAGAGGAGDAGQDAGITTSLITTGQTSLSSVTASRGPDLFLQTGLNDGVANAADNNTLTFYNSLNTLPVTLTFKLSQAYNITSITSLAGWRDTFFGSQIVQVLVETNNSTVYNSLGTVTATPYTGAAPPGFQTVPNEDFSTLVKVYDDATTFVATNVTGVRFVYTDPYPTFPTYNGTVLRELSVFGSVAVPEPSAALLSALGILPLLRRRRSSGN